MAVFICYGYDIMGKIIVFIVQERLEKLHFYDIEHDIIAKLMRFIRDIIA